MTEYRHTFGTDPEVFINSGPVNRKGLRIPNIVPPAQLEENGIEFEIIDDKKVLLKEDEFQWSEDGAAIEAQIMPSNDLDTFYNRFSKAYSALDMFLMRNLRLRASNSILGYFDVDKYWKEKDERFRMCVIFGCDPDQFPGLYIEEGLEDYEDEEELDVSSHTFRYGGGHIHIQSPEDNPMIYFDVWDVASIVFDFFIGLANSTITRYEHELQQEHARLEYYGKPGRIRLQAYSEGKFGIEYRVLSNLWLKRIQNVDKILTSADIAAHIVEQDMGVAFINDFRDRIPEVYNSITELDKKNSIRILDETLDWTVNNRLVDINEAAKVMG